MLFLTCVIVVAMGQAESPAHYDGSVPIAAARGKILVPVRIGGGEALPFLLDSETDTPILDVATASALGIAAGDGDTATVSGLTVGAFSVPQPSVQVAVLSGLGRQLGVTVAGLLPARLGEGLSIEFSRERLAFTPMAQLRQATRYRYSTSLRKNVSGLQVAVSVNGGKLQDARIDLTYAGTLAVPQALAAGMGLLEPSVPRIEFDVPKDGPRAEGRVQVRLEKVSLGGAEMAHVLCTLRESGDALVLGTGFLKNFDVFFDVAGGRMLLAPLSPSPAEDPGILGYGFVIGDVSGGLWSLLVAANSPAFRAGIKTGDRVKAINGEDAANLTYEEIARLLTASSGRSIKLSIQRGAETKEFTVTAESLPPPAP